MGERTSRAAAVSPVASSDYPSIDDYALIGDCRIAALVGRDGSLDWLCLPHFSGGALFAALLDRERGGRFAMTPVGPYEVSRRYLPHSGVLETVFHGPAGRARLTDCVPVLDNGDRSRQLQPQRELIRRLEVLEGEVELEVVFDPRPDFGRAAFELEHLGRLGWCCRFGAEAVYLQGDRVLQAEERGVGGRWRVAAGETVSFTLIYVYQDIATLVPLSTAATRIEHTVQWWRQWCARCTYDGPYREAVHRSLLTLKQLTYSLSGAVVAAPTASLPETVGGIRNWDYRYCWLRDAALTLRAFIDLGHVSEGAHFLEWLLHATRLTQPFLQVMYDVYGETRLHEEELDHLAGYKGSRPVRIGNGAHDQLQLDVYGSVTLAAWLFLNRGGRLGASERHLLVGFGRVVCNLWRQPDQGIWEIRDPGRHHTYSKFMCWLCLAALLDLHDQGRLRVPVERFRRERDAIAEAIEQQGFNERLNSYVDRFDGDQPDASLLLMGCFGYRPADDPRIQGTLDFIDQRLGQGPLIRRYPEGVDGLPGVEGAFGICSFWAVDLLARAGRLDEATRRFEALLEYANDVGLYGEEIDPDSGAALGNFPQAFTHVGLITAAQTLVEQGQR